MSGVDRSDDGRCDSKFCYAWRYHPCRAGSTDRIRRAACDRADDRTETAGRIPESCSSMLEHGFVDAIVEREDMKNDTLPAF